MTEYYEIKAEVIPKEALGINRAKQVATALENNDYSKIVNCHRNHNGKELITAIVEVQRATIAEEDIKWDERVSIEFDKDDRLVPTVCSLRKDFPRLIHTNMGKDNEPVSLCLYEETWEEIQLSWTAPKFIEQIRTWFEKASKGELHAEDQPLEPFIVSNNILLVNSKSLVSKNVKVVKPIRQIGYSITWALVEKEELENNYPINVMPVVVEVIPLEHGVINSIPQNLKELSRMLSDDSISFIECFSNSFNKAYSNFIDGKQYDDIKGSNVCIIVNIPKKREKNGGIEGSEIKAFVTHQKIREVGCDIGVMIYVDKGLDPKVDGLPVLIGRDKTKTGESITFDVLRVVTENNRNIALQMASLDLEKQPNISQIGAGALGSQIYMNLIKMGFGNWSLIDHDFLLPHNTSKHYLCGSLGYGKAELMAYNGNLMLNEVCSSHIAAEVLGRQNNDEDNDNIFKALLNSDIIIDASTKVEVERHIALDIEKKGNKITVFINPKGTDLVILSDGKGSVYRLDILEMQYYRGILRTEYLKDHFKPPEDRIRYSQSCRDVTNRIPQDVFAVFGGIAARFILNCYDSNKPFIKIWRYEKEITDISSNSIDIFNFDEIEINGWAVYYDDHVINSIKEARKNKLPNETGGVLLGCYDMKRKRIYIVDILLAPADSEERPYYFVRGCKGLKDKVREINGITGGNLVYVGEWHSHPEGCSSRPSNDDNKAFKYQLKYMQKDGYPAIQLIYGTDLNIRLEE